MLPMQTDRPLRQGKLSPSTEKITANLKAVTAGQRADTTAKTPCQETGEYMKQLTRRSTACFRSEHTQHTRDTVKKSNAGEQRWVGERYESAKLGSAMDSPDWRPNTAVRKSILPINSERERLCWQPIYWVLLEVLTTVWRWLSPGL
jgi:hypothetical protein